MLCSFCGGKLNNGVLIAGGSAGALAGLGTLAFFEDFFIFPGPGMKQSSDMVIQLTVDSFMVDGVV